MARPHPAARATNRAGRRTLAGSAALAVLAAPALLALPASAQTGGAPDGTFAGTTFAQGIAVDLTPPDADTSALSLALLQARGISSVTRSGGVISPETSTAFAGVIGGTIQENTPEQLAMLNGAVATLDEPGPSEGMGEALPENPLLNLSIADFNAAVDAATGSNSSDGEPLTLSTEALGDIAELEPLTGPLQDGLMQLTDALDELLLGGDGGDGALDPVEDVLGDILGMGPTDSLPPEVSDLLEDPDFDALIQQLLALDDLLFNTPLLALTDITQSQSTEQTAAGVRTTASTSLAALEVLGGAPDEGEAVGGLTIAGPQTTATSFVDGRAGGATATADTVQAARLGVLNLLDLVLGADGPIDLEVLDGLGDVITDEIEAGAADVEAALNGALGQAGLRLEAGAEDTEVSDDGMTAIARASGLLISLTLPGAGAPEEGEEETTTAPLLRLAIGDSQAVSTAMVAAAPTPPTATATNSAASPVSGPLPRTGTEGGLLGGVAVSALLGAAVLRRRRAAGQL